MPYIFCSSGEMSTHDIKSYKYVCDSNRLYLRNTFVAPGFCLLLSWPDSQAVQLRPFFDEGDLILTMCDILGSSRLPHLSCTMSPAWFHFYVIAEHLHRLWPTWSLFVTWFCCLRYARKTKSPPHHIYCSCSEARLAPGTEFNWTCFIFSCQWLVVPYAQTRLQLSGKQQCASGNSSNMAHGSEPFGNG